MKKRTRVLVSGFLVAAMLGGTGSTRGGVVETGGVVGQHQVEVGDVDTRVGSPRDRRSRSERRSPRRWSRAAAARRSAYIDTMLWESPSAAERGNELFEVTELRTEFADLVAEHTAFMGTMERLME